MQKVGPHNIEPSLDISGKIKSRWMSRARHVVCMGVKLNVLLYRVSVGKA